MKYKTIREGEQAVIYDHLGHGRLVVGPERIFLFRERLKKLEHVSATQYEYLVIKDNRGFVTHKPGPCHMFKNQLEFQSVSLQQATKVDANHVLVVYKRHKDNSVERKIVNGPTVFIPEAEEWCHQFSWHGEDEITKGRMIPAKNKFEQLAVVPDQFYYDVREVRTTDDTLLTVKLMIFFELDDIIKMLEHTKDPVADMINGVCADIIAFAGKLAYESFLTQTKILNELHSYPQLHQRAKRIGYRINKVIYRGYHASDQLQEMQDTAIATRTNMRLNAELEEQHQKLHDFKLCKEQERTDFKHEMESSKLQHKQKLDELVQNHKLEMDKLTYEAERDLETLTNNTQIEIKRAENESGLNHLQDLSNLNVDLTQYLLHKQNPPTNEVFQIMRTQDPNPIETTL